MQQHRFRQLAADFSFLIAGEFVCKLFTFAAFGLLARIFGPERFGHLEFVLAGMMFATLLADFGANPLGSREVAKHPHQVGQIVGNLVAMRVILAAVSFLLGLLVGGKSVGWFSAAHRPVLTLHTFVWLYFCNLLLTISRCSGEPPQVLSDLMRHSLSIVSWGTVFIGVIGVTMAEPVLVLVYGADYRNAAAVMRILIWRIPVSFLGSYYRYILIGFGKQRYEFYAHVVAAAVSVGLAFALIPVLFEQGAAISLLVGVSGYLAITDVFARRHVRHIPFAKHFVKPLLTAGVTVLTFLSLRAANVWLAGLASATAYVTVMAVWEPQGRRLWTHVIALQERDDDI